MGTCVSACPANATRPMRSDVRARTNSIAVCLATSMRFAGAKSSACILPEISTASTMEIPSLRDSLRAAPIRGPAAAMIQAPRQALRSVTGRRATHRRSAAPIRSEEHTSELQSHLNLVCRLLLEKKKKKKNKTKKKKKKKKKK